MSNMRSHSRIALAAAFTATILGGSVELPASANAQEQPFQVASSDCYSIGQQIAAQTGGTLARASQAEEDGQAVCVIVVLVPGKNGQRPRRQEFVVPRD